MVLFFCTYDVSLMLEQVPLFNFQKASTSLFCTQTQALPHWTAQKRILLLELALFIRQGAMPRAPSRERLGEPQLD